MMHCNKSNENRMTLMKIHSRFIYRENKITCIGKQKLITAGNYFIHVYFVRNCVTKDVV